MKVMESKTQSASRWLQNNFAVDHVGKQKNLIK